MVSERSLIMVPMSRAGMPSITSILGILHIYTFVIIIGYRQSHCEERIFNNTYYDFIL